MNKLSSDNHKSSAKKKAVEPSIVSQIEVAASKAEILWREIPTPYRLRIRPIPSFGTHSDVSGPSRELIKSIHFELKGFDKATTKQITDRINRFYSYSKENPKQIRKALRWLKREGIISNWQGSESIWQIEMEDPPERLFENLGSIVDRREYLSQSNMEKFDKDSRQ